MEAFTISLIVPTRGRLTRLRSFLNSVARTVTYPHAIEIILIMDEDDPGSHTIEHNQFTLRKIIVPPGKTMGQLNNIGVRESTGAAIMLLNDDVECKTHGWDQIVRRCFLSCPDEILLIHVNDTLMQTALCTFPIVSRTYCELLGNICPEDYHRYRIDDHIEDVFNLLGVLGERRTVYLPNVIFEHHNYEEREPGKKQYFADETILTPDALTFDQYFAMRKQQAVQLMLYIHPTKFEQRQVWQNRLQSIHDSFSLRTPARLRVISKNTTSQFAKLRNRIQNQLPGPTIQEWENTNRRWEWFRRIINCYHSKGIPGLLRAVSRRVIGIGRTRYDKTGNDVCPSTNDSVVGHVTEGT